MAAERRRGVHRGASAHHLGMGQVDRVTEPPWLALLAPVVGGRDAVATTDVGRDRRPGKVRTGLEEEDRSSTVLAEACGEHAARGAAADDDDIDGAPCP